jgi:hypothetical protein
MKTPTPQTAEMSAPDKSDYTPGTLPKRTDTVLSAVLAALLESKIITGMDSVFKQSTTRLSHHIWSLSRDYGWSIERCDVSAGTNDGRIACITEYWLPQATIAKAFEVGARDWIASVNAARAERRKQSEKCKARALLINKYRMKRINPRQSDLWGDA